MQPHASKADSLHLTVFMMSQPGDPRPDPFVDGGGFDPSRPPVPIPGPSAATLQHEITVLRSIACTGRPAFEVECCELPPCGSVWCNCMLHGLASCILQHMQPTNSSHHCYTFIMVQGLMTCRPGHIVKFISDCNEATLANSDTAQHVCTDTTATADPDILHTQHDCQCLQSKAFFFLRFLNFLLPPACFINKLASHALP